MSHRSLPCGPTASPLPAPQRRATGLAAKVSAQVGALLATLYLATSPALATTPSNPNPANSASTSTPGNDANAPLRTGQAFSLQGRSLQGQPFTLASLRGKVVLVYYWSTDCPVCLDKMPELRANAEGWRGKPFVVVNVHVDRQIDPARLYWQAVGQTAQHSVMGPVLWRGDGGFADSIGAPPPTLPYSVLLNTQGQVVAQWRGRMPAEAWDAVADLLP